MRQWIAVIFLATALFAEPIPEQEDSREDGRDEMIAENEQVTRFAYAPAVELKHHIAKDPSSELKTSIIPYLQVAYGILPGGGCSVRFQKAYFGLQIDANVGTVGTAMVQEATLSALFYPRAKSEQIWDYGGWNLGVGAGIDLWADGRGSATRLVCPLSAGYQGRKHSVNVAIHPVSRELPWPFLPSVQYGWCF